MPLHLCPRYDDTPQLLVSMSGTVEVPLDQAPAFHRQRLEPALWKLLPKGFLAEQEKFSFSLKEEYLYGQEIVTVSQQS